MYAPTNEETNKALELDRLRQRTRREWEDIKHDIFMVDELVTEAFDLGVSLGKKAATDDAYLKGHNDGFQVGRETMKDEVSA
ncbi:MAG: hypothetical protein M1378_00285 [Bacteroidetes bacterium]|nr:hypothetical protein [Bacteroidota bacterium]